MKDGQEGTSSLFWISRGLESGEPIPKRKAVSQIQNRRKTGQCINDTPHPKLLSIVSARCNGHGSQQGSNRRNASNQHRCRTGGPLKSD